MQARKKAASVAETAEKHKAYNLRILEVSRHCDFADYFVILSASSTRHARALAEAVAGAVDLNPSKAEGYASGDWILLDLGDVIVHVFHEPVRAYYSLDKLWGHVPSVTLHDLAKRRRRSAAAGPAV